MTPTRSSGTRLPSGARRYIAATIALAGGVAAVALSSPAADGSDVAAFLALALGAAIAHLAVIEIRANHGFPTSIAFLVAGALLLPPELVVLLGAAEYLPDVLLRRTSWPIQAFNISNGTLNVMAAWLAATAVTGGLGDGGEAFAVAGLVAAAVFVLLNHLLLAGVLKLGRGHSLRSTGLFSADSLSVDLVLALVGVAVAGLADRSVVLVVIALAPLLIAHRFLRLLAALQAPEPAQII